MAPTASRYSLPDLTHGESAWPVTVVTPTPATFRKPNARGQAASD